MQNHGFEGLSKNESELKLAYFDFIDINHTVLHNIILSFHLMKTTKNENELTFSYKLFQDDYRVILQIYFYKVGRYNNSISPL